LTGTVENAHVSLHTRRDAVRYCGVVSALALGGCLGSRGLSNANARERALTAEERYLRTRLGNATCVETWRLTSFTGREQSATVTNRTAEGVTVAVTHPYSFSSENRDAAVETDARYLVTEDEARRVDGTEVSPCPAATSESVSATGRAGQFRANRR
jgi:hypothetical protein